MRLYQSIKQTSAGMQDAPKPIVPRLISGLGNQMSCMAGAYELARNLRSQKRVVVLDEEGVWGGGKNKHDKSGRATAAHKFWPNTPRLPKGAIRGSYVVDNSHNMIPAPDNILPQLWGPNTYAKHKTIVYSGWCYHHFATEQVLRETVKNYAVIPPLSQDCNEFRGGLDNLDSAFFLHIRRGDYLKLLNRWTFGLDLHKRYYRNSIQHFSAHLAKGASILVCSDDVLWCERNLPLMYNEVPKSAWRFSRATRADDTLILMALCGLGGITANSSLSWWGMVLGTYKFKEDRARLYVTPSVYLRKTNPIPMKISRVSVTLPRNCIAEPVGDQAELFVLCCILVFIAIVLAIKIQKHKRPNPTVSQRAFSNL